VNELKKNSDRFSLNRIFLLSDGRLNRGLSDPDEIASRVNKASAEGVSTSTYGLSEHFDESVMRLMAEVGGGQLRYGERVEDLFEAFEEELDLINALYASQLRLKIKPAPGVRVRCLNKFVERDGSWILPDLAFGVELWAGLSVSVSAEAASAEGPLFEVEVSHADLQVSTQGSFERPVSVNADAFSAVGVDPEVEAYFAELKVSGLKDEAAQASRNHEWERVRELIEQMRALPLNLQQKEELTSFEELTRRRKSALVSKEAFTSSSRARRSMKSSKEHYMSLMSPDEQASYMHRKSRHGRNKGDQD
jgi:Ca-activated chloride channel family protein